MSNTNVKYINETWLSNQLAWLLDPNGSHGLGSEFAKEFFAKVLGDSFVNKDLNLDSFEPCREFYLQVNDLTKKNRKKMPRRIDIVFMDLLQKTVIVIENKFDGNNSKNQLSEYMQIQEIFPDCEIYFIFLSFDGKKYVLENGYEIKEDDVEKAYNIVSWKTDIKTILKNLAMKNYDIFKLYQTIDNYENSFEPDFTDREILLISENIINLWDQHYGLSTNNSIWKTKENKLTTKNKRQDVFFKFNVKSIDIRFNNSLNNRNSFSIQNSFSNKQIINYLIYVLKQATMSEKNSAYKNVNLSKINQKDIYMQLVSDLKEKNIEIFKKIGGLRDE